MSGSLSLTLLAASCTFARPPDVGETDAPPVVPIDAVDAPPPCVADTITCTDDVYTACSPTGTVALRLDCPLGCAPDDPPACLDIDPHNGLAMYLDIVSNPPDIVLAGPAILEQRLVSPAAVRSTPVAVADSPPSVDGGGGGGGGGHLLLEAPQVMFDGPSVVISTKGGGGAGGSGTLVVGQPGADGGTGPNPAAGGGGPNSLGGSGALLNGPGDGNGGNSTMGGAGGGGSAGIAAIYSRAGLINPINGATILSPKTVGAIRKRRVP